MSVFESRVQRRRRLAGVTLEQLDRQMQERWEAVRRAWGNGAAPQEEARLYGDYLHALDDYQFKRRESEATRSDAIYKEN